jgi:hypothetical protein
MISTLNKASLIRHRKYAYCAHSSSVPSILLYTLQRVVQTPVDLDAAPPRTRHSDTAPLDLNDACATRDYQCKGIISAGVCNIRQSSKNEPTRVALKMSRTFIYLRYDLIAINPFYS